MYNLLKMINFFTGIPCGLANQERSLSWTVLFLSHQTLLHLEHPDHPAVCFGFQLVRHFADDVSQICRQLFRQLVGSLV